MNDLHLLSELDEKLGSLRKKSEPYVARLENLKKNAGAISGKLAPLEASLHVEQKKLRSSEIDLKAIEEKLVAETRKLDAITSAKAAIAVEHELEALRKKKDALEEEMLGVMEVIERHEEERAKLAVERETTSVEVKTLEAEIAESQSFWKVQADAIIAERTEVLARVDPEIRKKYLALDASGIISPFSRADAGACIRCSASLKPNTLSKLSAGLPAPCDNCKRILIPA